MLQGFPRLTGAQNSHDTDKIRRRQPVTDYVDAYKLTGGAGPQRLIRLNETADATKVAAHTTAETGCLRCSVVIKFVV
jgi:hypothetical protein